MTPSAPPFALITGASRGIGAEYATVLASQGYDLLLIARDEERLTKLSRQLEKDHSSKAHICVLDLAKPNSANQLFVTARDYCHTPDLLINNAGFGLYGEFVNHPLPRIQDMLHLHIQSVVESIRLFLPGMIERGSGDIINVASLAGMFSIPYMAEYAATKTFLISFSEALAYEVQSTGVRIQVCCPGQTATEFHVTAGFQPSNPLTIQTASQVVQASLAALRQNQTLVTIGWQGKMFAFLAKWMPRKILTKQTGRRIRLPSHPDPNKANP